LFGAENGGDSDEVIVTEADLAKALDELIDDRARLTRVILGGEQAARFGGRGGAIAGER